MIAKAGMHTDLLLASETVAFENTLQNRLDVAQNMPVHPHYTPLRPRYTAGALQPRYDLGVLANRAVFLQRITEKNTREIEQFLHPANDFTALGRDWEMGIYNAVQKGNVDLVGHLLTRGAQVTLDANGELPVLLQTAVSMAESRAGIARHSADRVHYNIMMRLFDLFLPRM